MQTMSNTTPTAHEPTTAPRPHLAVAAPAPEPAAARARWDSLPAEPGAAWLPLAMRAQPVRQLADMWTDLAMLAVGEVKYIPKYKPASARSAVSDRHAQRVERLSEEAVREVYARAQPIVDAGRLATEIRGFAPQPGGEPGETVALLTPAGHWLPVCKRRLSWFKRKFPGCLFWLGADNAAAPMVAVTHPDHAEPVGVVAAMRKYNNKGKLIAQLPRDGQPCELSMPANAPIAKPGRAHGTPKRKPTRRISQTARDGIAQVVDYMTKLAAAGEPPYPGGEVVVTAGRASWRIYHEAAALKLFAKRFKSSRPELAGPVSFQVVESPVVAKVARFLAALALLTRARALALLLEVDELYLEAAAQHPDFAACAAQAAHHRERLEARGSWPAPGYRRRSREMRAQRKTLNTRRAREFRAAQARAYQDYRAAQARAHQERQAPAPPVEAPAASPAAAVASPEPQPAATHEPAPAPAPPVEAYEPTPPRRAFLMDGAIVRAARDCLDRKGLAFWRQKYWRPGYKVLYCTVAALQRYKAAQAAALESAEIPEPAPTPRPRPRRRTLADELMSEVISYGGLLATRAEVYRMCLASTGSRRAADWFAFHPRAAGPEELAARPWWRDHPHLAQGPAPGGCEPRPRAGLPRAQPPSPAHRPAPRRRIRATAHPRAREGHAPRGLRYAGAGGRAASPGGTSPRARRRGRLRHPAHKAMGNAPIAAGIPPGPPARPLSGVDVL